MQRPSARRLRRRNCHRDIVAYRQAEAVFRAFYFGRQFGLEAIRDCSTGPQWSATGRSLAAQKGVEPRAGHAALFLLTGCATHAPKGEASSCPMMQINGE
jgi:hypothetical protein